MDNTLVLCGGTGAHVSVALLRLHTLGYALGFFDLGDRPFDFPRLFLVDQDAGDGRERAETAWQVARGLVARHPGRYAWQAATGNPRGPELQEVTPLPIGPEQDWYKPPHSTLATRFERSPLLAVLASPRQRQIDYSKGMMGSPAIGSLLFRLKQYDERGRDLNHDETYSQMLNRQGRVVVAGSGVGGTGASVGPTLARRLAERPGRQVMAVMILNWFQFVEDQSEGDEERRAKAQLRNRIMRENANCALEFYGKSLAREVAAVPVGMPERCLVRRHFTADLSQPLEESYVHAVAALCSLRHFLAEPHYGPGLYIMGAVESGRLDARTAIPGGTLQDLANQAATQADLLATWQRVLASGQTGRVTPALYAAVEAVAEPAQVAAHLAEELDHYRQQLAWMSDKLGIAAHPDHELTREVAGRRRLREGRQGLGLPAAADPQAVAAALFAWTARWIRETASAANGLRVAAGGVHGGQWPDLRYEGVAAAAKKNGDLTRFPDANIAAVLEAFVDRRHLSANGWPHPLAAADYFRHVLQHGDKVAMRQLELMLAGLVAGVLELRPLGAPAAAGAVSLEGLAAEYRREGFEGLAELGLYVRERAGALVGFNSPHTLLCPVPRLDDENDELWQRLWTLLSGASDGARWSEAISPHPWREHDLAVLQVRSWLELLKRTHEGTPPAWTRAFETYGGAANVAFGAGQFLPVYWEAGGTTRTLKVSLPTHDDDEVWVPPPGTAILDESEVLSRVPELGVLRDGGRELFSMVELVMPERSGKVRAWWQEHLTQLRQLGKLDVCSRTEAGALIVGLRKEGVLHVAVFANSLVLRRSAIQIASCTPLRQEPVPGSQRADGEMLYPDIPLKADYLDLVEAPAGGDLLALVRTGDDLRSPEWLPRVGRDGQGRPLVRWNLKLRGRAEPLPVEVRFDSDDAITKAHRAHIMVWPRFRTLSGAGWRTYYLYERCSDPRLFCDTLWLDAAAGSGVPARLRLRRSDGVVTPYPLSFRTGTEPAHTGGPPVALSLRNVKTDEEQGLYLVHLESLPESPLGVAIGVDFGTSHSVAAVSTGGDAPTQVKLTPDLARAGGPRGLTLHLSERYSHIVDPQEKAGLLANGSWLPTYRERGDGILPSELLLTGRNLEAAKSQKVDGWQPLRDFTIPPIDIARADLARWVLTDFKWDTGSDFFRGREAELREHYLGLFLELVLAEVVMHHVKGLPTQPVKLTFTYPLRSDEAQVVSLRNSLKRLLRRGSESFGLRLELADDIGLFDESRAARLTTESSGEVCLVADLGGGTLDLFIAAYEGDLGPAEDGRVAASEVADSARLGGNLLLRHLAEHAEQYLPRDGGWTQGDARERETKLRAWMRSRGASGLFGTKASDGLKLEEMGVKSFLRPAQGERARHLLDRYFRLIVEYMARNLVAFLVQQWFPRIDPQYHDRLKISVQLRGNGWRLRYQQESYEDATRAIQEDVRRRVEQLWTKVEGNNYPVPGANKWGSVAHYAVADPKAAPVKNVVGRAMSHEQALARWYAHTLVDLEVRRKEKPARVPWHSPVPFMTGGTRRVELHALAPELVLSSEMHDDQVVIADLEAPLQGRVNEALQRDGRVDPGTGTYLAPVASLVWEAVFASPQFWPDTKA
ncbi:MAG TPA: hypothetical protein VHG32_19995 [Thermoanaerobaculia bacterium]|jgi:hypothetical protein|nr:hypothetical protein [Thermoanaerobaculia bacterium]